MNKEHGSVSFSRWAKPWKFRLAAGVLAVLVGSLIWADSTLDMAISLAPVTFVAIGFLLVQSFQQISISNEGITLSLFGTVRRKIDFSEIRTLVKTYMFGGRYSPRTPALTVSSVSTEEMATTGEQLLRKKFLLREELKFREGRSDWGDLCIGAVFYPTSFLHGSNPGNIWRSGIWFEFTPEREQLILQRYPYAEYREPKRYDDPPSIN